MKEKGIASDLHGTIQSLQSAADHGDARARRLLWDAKFEIRFRSRNQGRCNQAQQMCNGTRYSLSPSKLSVHFQKTVFDLYSTGHVLK